MTTHAAAHEDPQVARARARIGRILQDKWTLEALLGVGGMAAVYAATHRNGKRVAVKVLHAEVSHDEDVRRRFLREGYAANTIQHEGAVSVLDDDVDPDGSAFLVMELLDGETVERRWERGARRLPVAEVLAIADQVLDVLGAAHAKNVVHRDIKPENLFLTKSGALKVLDFGIARVFEAQAQVTTTRVGIVMGTPAFMAPEQARARWDEVDGRTDLWAVGATMFTLLSGRHVHEGMSGNEQLILSATTPAASVASLVSTLTPPVVDLVDRALAFEREQRWPDARSMKRATRAALEALAGGAVTASSIQRMVCETTEPVAPSAVIPACGASDLLDREPSLTSAVVTMVGAEPPEPSTQSDWSRVREARAAEVSSSRARLALLQQLLSPAKKKTAQAATEVEAGRAAKAQLERWLARQVGTRAAAVDEAQSVVRAELASIARRTIVDCPSLGAPLDAAREQIATLERAAESAARDVTIHQAALGAYDPRAMLVGVLLLGVVGALLFALAASPFVWRATRVVEPPPAVAAPASASPVPTDPTFAPPADTVTTPPARIAVPARLRSAPTARTSPSR